ncbi:MAG: dihydropteroate synthase, partial [Thermoanaerobaculia bacterium]|nr:dihydropteroate synthase [Thermoanaerobaculia bacterium]
MSHELSFSGGRRIVLGGDREPDSMPVVMGIVNVTPDSFSDGGRYLDPTRAVDQALRLIDQGAEIVDLGAESTRPGGGVYGAGMNEISAHDELNRLLPVLEALRPRTDAAISIDTRKGEVAREVLHAGADLINDVGGLGDSELAEVVAESGCPVVIMHSRGELSSMQRDIR